MKNVSGKSRNTVVDIDLTGDFWHGTTRRSLASILETGLDPAATKGGCAGHICLSRDPQIALTFARLHSALSGATGDMDLPAMIRIPGARLDPDLCRTETGIVDVSSYGAHLEGRRAEDLEPFRDDWRAILKMTDCVGYCSRIPVDPAMIDDGAGDIPMPTLDDIFGELDRAVIHDPRTAYVLPEHRTFAMATPGRLAA